MKTLLYKIVVSIFLLGSTLYSSAQTENKSASGWTMGVNIGTYVYQGDLTSSVAGSWKTMRPGLGISMSKAVSNRMSLKYALVIASLAGDDTKYKDVQKYREYRQFYYKSRFAELSISDNFYLYNLSTSEKRFNPYLSAGIGGAYMFSKTNSSAKTVWSYFSASNLQEHVMEDSVKGIPTFLISVPLGLGVNYRLNDRMQLNIEGLYRLSTTDYLDGFSRAGNNNKNDYFYSISAGLHVAIGKKKTAKKQISIPSPTVMPIQKKEPVVDTNNQFIDTDRDGIADSVDKCPLAKGSVMNAGCPDSVQMHKADTVVQRIEKTGSALVKTYTIYFDYNHSSLDSPGFSQLNEIMKMLRSDTSLKVVLKGHTDMQGSVEANYILSLQRTKVCADYLASYHIDRSRIKQEAYSKLQPAVDPADERLQWKNRRVEVLLMHE